VGRFDVVEFVDRATVFVGAGVCGVAVVWAEAATPIETTPDASAVATTNRRIEFVWLSMLALVSRDYWFLSSCRYGVGNCRSFGIGFRAIAV
jgi:hypothetical protein